MFSCSSVFRILLLGILGFLGFLGFLGGSQVSGSTCADKPVFTPSSLVVKYGDSAKATCEICKTECVDKLKGLEVPVGTTNYTNLKETVIEWTVDSLAEWDMGPLCYYTMDSGKQCDVTLPIILYKPPQSVSISFVGHEVLRDSNEYTLQCTVLDVAPLGNLNVTFYRGLTPLGHHHFNSSKKRPEDRNFTRSYTTSKDDNGAQFWCEAKMELGPAGPNPPPVVKSKKLTAMVKYKPELLVSESSDPIQVTKGKPLYLNCSAEGSPPLLYTWTLPFNSSSAHDCSIFTVDSVDFEHEGVYICTVRNTEGMKEVMFNVHVKVDLTVYIIVAAAVGVLLLFIGAILIYRYYYKPNRMGNYTLKDVLRLRKKHTAVPVTE